MFCVCFCSSCQISFGIRWDFFCRIRLQIFVVLIDLVKTVYLDLPKYLLLSFFFVVEVVVHTG